MKILPLLLLAGISAFAQKPSKDTLVRYFDARLEPCKKKEFVFIGVIIRDPSGWNGIIYDDSTRVLMRGRYLDENCLVKDGWFIYYFPDGRRSLGGKYENNIRQGTWMRWHSNGQLRDSLQLGNNLPNGSSISWFYNGNRESEGIYRQGKYEGNWIFYHENGKVATREKYEDGKLADLECFDSSGNSLGMNCAIQRNPEIKGKYGGFLKYLQDSIIYPKEAQQKAITGIVQMEFMVTKEGLLKDIKILSSPDPLLTSEVMRVVKSVPGWYPATWHNRTMDFTFKMNVPFYGEQVPITGSWNQSWFNDPTEQ